MAFHSELIAEDGIHWLALQGRLDSATSGTLEQTIQPLFEGAVAVVLVMDLEQLAYISSAGLRVVLMAAKRAKQSGGRLLLCGLSPAVRELFEISGFLKILEVCADRAEASRLIAA
ncbi:putative anti-sigma factor antagonist BtrV [Sphingomonas sp. S2M10]|uniref:STAS domain-containing protein n=1 Tax=Sphingomonas sp. S2M10 TaxID=2705010 RepID=UPI001456BD9F|nr:STAS domain-containing protein [Sphingomonas sp. S2M10]NLS25649.1 putative anti-sigma factor antagonist BtrV [Sphingomonas sp. S2M10]